MALTDTVILLAGLVEMQLPDRTVRWTDGGFVDWGADRFEAEDPDFGTIESVESVAEAVSDEAPAGRLTLLPTSVAAADDLFRTDAQGSRIRFWLGEVDRSSGALAGDPELLFDGLVDSITLRLGRQGRHVDVEFMAAAERLFMTREGNVLSSRFHNVAWPGEKGFDHCTGVPGGVAWGTRDPADGTVHFGGLFGALRGGG